MKRLLIELDCCCCVIALLSVVQAIPIQDIGTDFGKAVNITHSENVCVHENTIYTGGQNFSTTNPCETCTCDPPGFSCSLSSCDLKPGCKAIHRANHCCPEYVCECEKDGRMYGNGEKVEEPNPCKVCYCKGGEIKCALVTCYTRDDCEPGYVAGICCPKYDHCPPLEMMKNKSTTPAPAQVIISDLKTETTPGLIGEEGKNNVSQAEEETTEPATSERYNSETTAEEEATPSEFYASSSEGMEISTAEFAEGRENDTISPELDHTAEELNETTETTTEGYFYTSTSEEPTTENFWTTEEYNETSTEISDATTEETTTEQITDEVFENKTEEYVATEPDTTTEDATTDPGIRLDAFKDEPSTTDPGEYTTEQSFSTSPYDSTTEYPETTTDTSSTDLYTTPSFRLEIQGSEFIPEITTEMTTEVSTEEISNSSVIKVIVPKTIKKDPDEKHNAADSPAPIVVMISADQIQFLKLAEEPPVYVENPDSGDQRPEQDHLGVMVVPKTTPTTVEMVKVVDGSVNATTEAAKSVNISFSFNGTDFIQER